MISAFRPNLQALASCFLVGTAPSPSPTLPADVLLKMLWQRIMHTLQSAFLLAHIHPTPVGGSTNFFEDRPPLSAPVNYVGSRRSQHKILIVLHVLFPQPQNGFRDKHKTQAGQWGLCLEFP